MQLCTYDVPLECDVSYVPLCFEYSALYMIQCSAVNTVNTYSRSRPTCSVNVNNNITSTRVEIFGDQRLLVLYKGLVVVDLAGDGKARAVDVGVEEP